MAPVTLSVLMRPRVRDQRRIDYLRAHIQVVWQAVQAGIPVSGYLLWSFMDNIEWAHGYAQRFGIVYVDFSTQKRYVNDSAYWYRAVIKRIGLLVG